MPRESVSEKSTPGRWLRSILARVSSQTARFRKAPDDQPAVSRPSEHLGSRRKVRLSTLLAPRYRLRIGFAGIVIVAGILGGSLALRSPSALPLNNAIWLDRTWTFGDLDSDRMRAFTDRLIENQIGTAYVYVSSLGSNNRWTGGLQGKGGFMDSRSAVADFVRAFKSQNEQLRVYGWIEIWTDLDNTDNNRLADTDLQRNIADFSRLLVSQLGFDGIVLDVKPLFSDNDDLVRLIGRVQSAVGLHISIAVAVTADLTPPELGTQEIASIASGTMWSSSFKKKVMAAADEVILLMYQSYRQEPLDYIHWVAYHVETYANEMEDETAILASIPDYSGETSAHNPQIETMARALDGVSKGLRRLDEDKRSLLTGIAIYSDEKLSQSDWDIFRESWLQR